MNAIVSIISHVVNDDTTAHVLHAASTSRSSSVNVRALMSHLRHESRQASTAASASSSYVDIRVLASTPDETASSSRSSTITRRRRLASSDDDNLWESSNHDRPAHPLAGVGFAAETSSSGANGNGWQMDDILEASRPNLRRLTTEVEREVAAASAASRSSVDDSSLRGSLDLLRDTSKPRDEVEVLMHEVKPGESLPGIALQYGIDLATLRKVNKLWPSDPVTLRTYLYVPLEACRWAKSTQSVVRGPEEGQITLVTRRSVSNDKGIKGKAVADRVPAFDGGVVGGVRMDQPMQSLSPPREVPTGDLSLNGATLSFREHQNGPQPIHPAQPDEHRKDEVITKVYDVLRLPASELSFFPKGNKEALSRKSLDAYTATTPVDRPAINRSASAASGLLHSRGHIPIGAFRKPFMPPTMTPATGMTPTVSNKSRRVPSLSRLGVPQLGGAITSTLSTLFSAADDGYSTDDLPIGRPTTGGTSRRSSRASSPAVAHRGVAEAPYELETRRRNGASQPV